MSWLQSLREQIQKRKGFVELVEDGVVLHGDGQVQPMAWNSVTRIDVARVPTLGVEDFWVVLFSGEQSIAIHDALPGFEGFSKAVLKRWPEIEAGWTKVFMGAPDVEEHATLLGQAG